MAFTGETPDGFFWMGTYFLPCIWAVQQGGCSVLEEGFTFGWDHLPETVGWYSVILRQTGFSLFFFF